MYLILKCRLKGQQLNKFEKHSMYHICFIKDKIFDKIVKSGINIKRKLRLESCIRLLARTDNKVLD